MATSQLRIASSDPASPKVVTLRSQIGNAQQTAGCDVDSITATVVVSDNEVFDDTLAEANASALEQAETERGPCQWTNDQQDCPSGYTGDSIPAGTVTSEVSKAAANAAAEALLDCSPLSIETDTNGQVLAMARQSDGKIYIGGTFTLVLGEPRSRVARLNADGSLDATFVADLTDTLSPSSCFCGAILPWGSGVLIGGYFNRVNGASGAQAIALLTTAGAIDGTWAGPAFVKAGNPIGQVIAIDDAGSGRFSIVGDFDHVNAVARLYAAVINADGSLYTSFADLNQSGGGGTGQRLKPSGSSYFYAGNFANAAGLARTDLVKTDAAGVGVAGFGNIAVADPGGVYDFVVQDDGKVIVVGNFATVLGTARNGIARLNTDGSLDTGYNPDVNNAVFRCQLLSSGRLLIAGSFTTVGGAAAAKLTVLNTDGSLYWPDLNADGTVWDALEEPSGYILAVGDFENIGGLARDQLVRISANGGVV